MSQSPARERLRAQPVRYGLAIDAQGRVIVALRSGALLCLGK